MNRRHALLCPPGAGCGFAALVAILAGGILGGCSQRDRLNPLDPENETTGGLIAGFGALAGNGQVEIRWTRLTQTGVLGYRVLRSSPGETPAYLPGFFDSNIAGTVDLSVRNDQTYIYRLVAQLSAGDSAVSPADTATPGTRKIVVLSAGIPGIVGLTPDARDVLYVESSGEAYEDMELDRTRGALWLSLPGAGRVARKFFDGSTAGTTLLLPNPTDISISALRGIGWIALPMQQSVKGFGPDPEDTSAFVTLSSVGDAHVVEAGTLDPTVWIGNNGGTVYRFRPDGDLVGVWTVGAPVSGIALDEERERAWISTRGSGRDAITVIDGVDSTVTVALTALQNVVDLAFDSGTRSLWISERGVPRGGMGRLSRASDDGVIRMSLGGLEPFGIMVEPSTGNCWVSSLKSNRLIEVSPGGRIERWSAPIDLPYAVRTMGG